MGGRGEGRGRHSTPLGQGVGQKHLGRARVKGNLRSKNKLSSNERA